MRFSVLLRSEPYSSLGRRTEHGWCTVPVLHPPQKGSRSKPTDRRVSYCYIYSVAGDSTPTLAVRANFSKLDCSTTIKVSILKGDTLQIVYVRRRGSFPRLHRHIVQCRPRPRCLGNQALKIGPEGVVSYETEAHTCCVL